MPPIEEAEHKNKILSKIDSLTVLYYAAWVDLPEGWKGTADELVAVLAPLVEKAGLDITPLSVRNVRYWRTTGLVSRTSGRSFGRREALEVLAVLKLRDEGLKGEAIQKRLEGLTDDELQNLITPTPVVAQGHGAAGMMTVLLAQGIATLYAQIDALPDMIVRQDDSIPRPMQDGMNLLGRLQLEAEMDDQAANIHDVLAACTRPLNTWGLPALSAPDFEHSATVLLDPDLFVPSLDCLSLARSVGQGAENVIEHGAFKALVETAQTSGRDADRVYTRVREFIGASSLTTLADLYAFANREGFPNAVLSLMTDRFYQRVPEAWLIAGDACRCAHCRTLMRPDPASEVGYRCPLSACREEFPLPVIDGRFDPAVARVVRPQLLAYWVNPAVDELKIYRRARDLGLVADLYPNRDACDVSIGGRIGIDVKAYSNPITLAHRLNRSIGRLSGYEKPILALPDALLRGRRDYLPLLRASLSGEAKRLDVMKVSAVLRHLEELADV